MIRAFLAIDLPTSLRSILARVQEELKKSGADVRWVPVGNVHLTLKFFGHLPENEVEPLTLAVWEVAREQASFQLELTGAGAFPSPASPRVVWVGLGGDLGALERFYRRLEKAFDSLGHSSEDRPFHPHLTLGRVRSPAGRERLTRVLKEVAVPRSPGFRVSEVILFKSTLSPQGSTYAPLKVISLG